MLTEDEQKIRRVEAALDGEKRVHSVFCNFMKKDPEDCPICKSLFLTDQMTPDEVWTEMVFWSNKRKSSSG